MKKVQNNKTQGRLYGLTALCFAIAYSVYCFGILPLYFSLDANVDFSRGVLPDLVGYLGVAVENVAIFVFYGVLIFGIYRFGYRMIAKSFLVFGVAAAYKYLANVIMSYVRYGAVPATWGWDAFNVVYNTALELLMLWIVTSIVRRIIARSRGQELDCSRLYDRSNFLMRSVLVCAIVTVGVKTFGNIVNDVILIVGYGFEVYFSMIGGVLLNYLSALILGALCYALTALVTVRLFLKDNAESTDAVN